MYYLRMYCYMRILLLYAYVLLFAHFAVICVCIVICEFIFVGVCLPRKQNKPINMHYLCSNRLQPFKISAISKYL